MAGTHSTMLLIPGGRVSLCYAACNYDGNVPLWHAPPTPGGMVPLRHAPHIGSLPLLHTDIHTVQLQERRASASKADAYRSAGEIPLTASVYRCTLLHWGPLTAVSIAVQYYVIVRGGGGAFHGYILF